MTTRIKSLSPADGAQEGEYDLRTLAAPALAGLPLKLFIWLMEGPFSGPVMAALYRQNNYPQVLEEQFIPEGPTYHPDTSGWLEEGGALVALLATQSPAQRAAAAAEVAWRTGNGAGAGTQLATAPAPRRRRIADFHRAYLAGEATPSQVAESVIRAVGHSEQQDPPMRFFIAFDPDHIQQQAAASTQRYAAGRPLSLLDGVPFAVKDIVDAGPYPTTAGTAFMTQWRQPTGNTPSVQSLMDAGAILIGKANLHEIGIGTTGLNTVHGTPRNPHDVGRLTGGSSSGSAALVAAGICPIAVGSDGGGSVRIPSALCGCVGLIPTAGRVSPEHGPAIDQTVSTLGPIAGCVEDCLLMYSLMANVGPLTAAPGQAPPQPLRLPRSLPPSGSEQPLKGKVAGICWPWFEDADPEVVEVCRAAVKRLEGLGLEVRGVNIPELMALKVAHSCTILSEMHNNMAGALAVPAVKAQLNRETRVSLCVAASFKATHYIQAQKIRTRIGNHFRRVFQGGCDFIITPTVPCVAPAIWKASLTGGISDIVTTTNLMRFVVGPNMLGLPAITIPVGAVPSPKLTGTPGITNSSSRGTQQQQEQCALPVGLQLIAPAWHEASLLYAAAALEGALGEGARPLPAVHYDVLQPAQQLEAKGAE